MNANLLNEFLILAKEQSFAEASDKLYISQSSLSRHMVQLESDLGFVLFDRSSKKVCLTDYGLMLVPYAQKVVFCCRETVNEYLHQAISKKNTINIGIANGCDTIIDISKIISSFSAAHPETVFNITNDFSTVLLDSEEKQLFDFIFIRSEKAISTPKLSAALFSKDSLAAYLSINHPLAEKEEFTIDDLRSQPIILNLKTKLSSRLFEETCRRSGFEPWIILRASHEQISRYLRSGTGIGIQFKGIYCNTHADRDIVISNITPEISSNIYFVYPTSIQAENKKDFKEFVLEHRQ